MNKQHTSSDQRPFTITDGGIETALVERLGQVLPDFSAFVLVDTAEGRDALREYYRPFIELAAERSLPLVLDTPTWHASRAWGDQLGYDATALAAINANAVYLVRETVEAIAPEIDITVNGCVGPKFDDYVASERMNPDEAAEYHLAQVTSLALAGADRVTAVTALDAAEAIGVVRAAQAANIDVAVSFAVGADGLLADGNTLADAIEHVDSETDNQAVSFFVNCAHPDEVAKGLGDGSGLSRIAGFRLNAARHDEEGAGDDPKTYAQATLRLRELVPSASIFGGCCGTDIEHIVALADQA